MAAGGGGGGVQRQTTEGEVIFSKISTVNPGKVEVREFAGEAEGSAMRTLWFENSPRVWQSAVRFDNAQPDFSDLPFQSSRALAFATSLSANAKGGSAMLIGLGGGSLVSFLLEHTGIPSLSVVEIDPVVLEAASFFGLPTTHPRLTLTEGCGLAAAIAAPPGSIDAIMLDAGSASGDDGGMYAPAAVFRSAEAFAALAAALAPGGVLAVTVAGGSAQELLNVLTLLEEAFPSTEGGGSNVCYLENRDDSHAWLRTPPAPVVLCFKPSEEAGYESPAASSRTMEERARQFEAQVPAAAAFQLPQRVRREWSDVAALRFRVGQLATFAQNMGGGTRAAEGAAAEAGANRTQLEVFAGVHGAVPALADARKSPGASSDASVKQLEVFRQNHPGVEKLQGGEGVAEGGGGADSAELVDSFRKGLGIGQTGQDASQLEIFRRNHPEKQ